MKKTLAVIVGLVLIIIIGGSWYLSSLVMYPPSECKTSHYVFCRDPGEIPLPFEEVRFETEDGVPLEGWYIPNERSSKGILLVHGHGGSKNEGLRFAKALYDEGFSLLAYNSRVLSSSDKAFASMGYHEVKDVKAAVDFLTRRKNISEVGVLGFSMGGATAIIAMSRDNRIKAGLFSSSYAHAVDELAEVGKRDFGLPRYPLLPFAVWIMNIRGDMDLNSVVPEEVIASISPRPVFIMHCDRDDYVDYSHAERLFSAAKEPKEMWTADCDRHEHIWNSNPEKATQVVTGFFSENL